MLAVSPMPALMMAAMTGCALTAGTAEHLPGVDQIVARMVQVEDQQRLNLRQYSVERRYILHNNRLKNNAELVARINYLQGEGKRFEIVSKRNVQGMFGHALEKMLVAEAENSRDGGGQNRISPRNYLFELMGTEVLDGRPCLVLKLTPKAKNKYLLNGRVFVDASEYAIARLEGHPAANVSFWIGKPYIVQDYRKIEGFWLASHNRSLVNAKLVGETELTIEYGEYDVQGVKRELTRGPSRASD